MMGPLFVAEAQTMHTVSAGAVVLSTGAQISSSHEVGWLQDSIQGESGRSRHARYGH